jgi:hypothetical protein
MHKVAFGVVVFLSLVSSLLGQIAGTKVVALREFVRWARGFVAQECGDRD